MTADCPICGGTSDDAQRHPDVVLRRCRECDHCYSALDSIASMAKYDANYGDVEHQNWFANPNTKLFDLISRWIDEEAAQSVVDVGCGRAQFLQHLRQGRPDLSLTGVEQTEFEPPAGIEMRFGEIQSIAFEKQFDVIVSLAVIEHVPDPAEYIARLTELCVPGGLIITMTINDRSILYATARRLHRLGISGPFEQLYSTHHLHHFNRTSLEMAMRLGGLELITRRDHNIPMAAVDFQSQGRIADTVRSAGVLGTFAVGRLTGRCYEQTLACRTPSAD